MHIPFAYEQDLCDVLAGFLPRLVALERQSFQATYVRRAVGQVIPDLLSISGPRNPVPLRMRGLSNLDAAIVSLLLIGRPLQPRTIADRLYAGLHQVQSRLNKLSSSGVIVTNPTGSFVMAPSIFQDGFHVVAVEAKLSRWREALAQAVTYRAFANRVFVALPEAVVYSKTGLLAEARGSSIDTDVGAEHLANVHPQDRRQSRILALRTIIRGQICWRGDVSMLLCRSGCNGLHDALGERGS